MKVYKEVVKACIMMLILIATAIGVNLVIR